MADVKYCKIALNIWSLRVKNYLGTWYGNVRFLMAFRSSRVLYYIFTQFWAHGLPLGSADDVIKTLNLNISGLANATEVIDPSMEPARDA